MFERVMYCKKIYLFNGAKYVCTYDFVLVSDSTKLWKLRHLVYNRVRIIYAKVKSINDFSLIRSNSNSLNTSCTHQGVVFCQIRHNYRDGCFRSQEARFFTVKRRNQYNL